MRAFAEAWPDETIVQQPVGQLSWGHDLVLLTKLKDPGQRLAYAQSSVANGWSRNVMNIQIETRLLARRGRAITNFEMSLLSIEQIERELAKDDSDCQYESKRTPARSIRVLCGF